MLPGGLLESRPVGDRPRSAVPWLLVAASALFGALMLYVMFAGYLPAKHRAARLEDELKGLYAREAQLQTQLVQTEQRLAQREGQVGQQLRQLRAERDTLARRVEELEQALAAARRPPARPRR